MRETFSSRWGIILAGLGMAVGTGNMWRFPRIAAEHGGAAFLIPWIIFLFTWSIPLLVAEFAIGRGTRRGVIGAFASMTGGRFAWMGGWVAVVTIMIGFYYAVVTGWTFRYVLAAAAGQITGEPGAYWARTASGVPAGLFHVVAALAGAFIIQRGVVRGLERANRFLVPILFVVLGVAVARSLTLPNASLGLEFLFNPDLSQLLRYETWLQALSQSAWSTGAGFGLILTFGIYLRREDDVALDATTIGFGDNSASLLAGLAIVPAVFAVLSLEEAHAALEAGNEGLMFIWIPELFARMAGGAVVMPLFFLALACAALSSLIAMIELATRILMDAGFERRGAVWTVTAAIILFGLPSAGSLAFLQNQDWVWGVGLMVSGLFISLLVSMYGVRRFVADHVNVSPGGFRVGPVFMFLLKFLVPAQFAVMFAWWMYRAAADDPAWWDPFETFSVGTCILQWTIALGVLVAFNRRLARASLRPEAGESG